MKVPKSIVDAFDTPHVSERLREIVREEIASSGVSPATDADIERIAYAARRGTYPTPRDALKLIARIRSAESK
jgi:hypothetical protein